MRRGEYDRISNYKTRENLVESSNQYMEEFKKQLKKGSIQKAYRGLMQYIMDLRIHFNNKFPHYFVSDSIYHGFMDMSYFAMFPEKLKQHKLKIAIVFLYDSFRFEIWLSGRSRQIQAEYWKIFKECDWQKYHLNSSPEKSDSIVEHVLIENPDFDNLDEMTLQIEKTTLKFINDIEVFLS